MADEGIGLGEASREAKETGRIEAFSDGVFAIATTLLILEIRPPVEMEGNAELLQALIRQWPSYFAYLLGFSIIVIMWINHHTLFNFIRRSSHGLLLLNSLLMLAISAVPFPTALVADYIGHPGENVAAMVYSGLGIVIAIFYNLLWRYATHRNRLIDRRTDPAAVQAVTRAYMWGPVMYTAALGLAFYSAMASLVLNLLLALFFALPRDGMRSLPLLKRPAGDTMRG
jgi:uncharacterized membrane protein